MQTQSKYIKSMLYLGNITDGERAEQSRCFTLQHFDYNLDRMLGERRELLNATREAMMNLSIKVQPDNLTMDLYRVFGQDEQSTFTIIFNGEFDDMGCLVSLENAMVVTGYILHIEESFSRAAINHIARPQERATIDVKVVMLKMHYAGNGSVVEIKF